MDTLSVACQCGRILRARAEHAGHQASCPSCGQPVLIPHSAIPDVTEGSIEIECNPLRVAFKPRRSTIKLGAGSTRGN